MQRGLLSADRLGAFSDAVIAVIITVMVLEMKAPDGSSFADLVPLWPIAISYAASYLFVAIIWVNHHYLLHLVRYPSSRLIWLNFIHLFAVSLLPFATAWVARSHMASAPVALYAVIFLVIDVAYLAFERAVFGQMDRTVVTERLRTWTQRRTLLAVLMFAAAAALAPFIPLAGFATVCCALLLYIRPEAIDGFAARTDSQSIDE